MRVRNNCNVRASSKTARRITSAIQPPTANICGIAPAAPRACPLPPRPALCPPQPPPPPPSPRLASAVAARGTNDNVDAILQFARIFYDRVVVDACSVCCFLQGGGGSKIKTTCCCCCFCNVVVIFDRLFHFIM